MKKSTMILLTVAGILLLIGGFCCLKIMGSPSGAMAALPFIMIGAGCGAFGHGMGGIISKRTMNNSPDIEHKLAIEKNDERNVEIGNRAKGKAYDAMIHVFGVLIMCFGLMQIDIYVLLLVILAYLIIIGISIYYRLKYEKEM